MATAAVARRRFRLGSFFLKVWMTPRASDTRVSSPPIAGEARKSARASSDVERRIRDASSLDAATAYEWGLVNRITAPGDFAAAVKELTETLKGKSPMITALGRRAFYMMEDMDLNHAVEYLNGMLTVNMLTEDAMEGACGPLWGTAQTMRQMELDGAGAGTGVWCSDNEGGKGNEKAALKTMRLQASPPNTLSH